MVNLNLSCFACASPDSIVSLSNSFFEPNCVLNKLLSCFKVRIVLVRKQLSIVCVNCPISAGYLHFITERQHLLVFCMLLKYTNYL